MTLCINPQCQHPQNSDQTTFCQTCGSELTLEGNFRVIRELGSGGFGKTYVAASPNHTKPQVLKVLINPMPKAVELFQREAEVLGKLQHPGIPHVDPNSYFVYFPRDSTDPLHCLMMELIEGLNLQEYMQQRGNRPVNQKRVLQWMIEVVKILQMVHSHNFFHRDIKPSNIMLRNDGRLALIDFGTARAVTGTYMAKQEAGGVTGIISTGYTPIEQLNGQAVQQSDFYALGRTIVYLLTAQEPSEVYQPHLDEFPWRQFCPTVNPEFANFLDQMMERVPKNRPGSTQQILQRLAELKGQVTTRDPIVNRQSQPGPPPLPPSTVDSIPPASIPSYATSNQNSGNAFPQYQSAPATPMGFMGTGPGVPVQDASPPYGVGSGLPHGAQTQGTGSWGSPQSPVRYAAFLPRTLAICIDLLLLFFAAISLVFFLGILLTPNANDTDAAVGAAMLLSFFVALPIGTWIYFAAFESSRKMATLGQQLVRIKVSDLNFQRISFGKATVRFVGKLVSALTLIGYPLALFSEDHRALHDLIAETVVIESQSRLH